MNGTLSRRGFLRAASVSLVGIGSQTVLARRGAAQETTTLSGQIVAESGATVIDDEVNVAGRDTYEHTRTDSNGKFSISVPTNNRYSLAYYKADARSDFEGVKNGAPHIFTFDSVTVGSEPLDLGKLTLPQAHIVDFRVLNSEGEPLMGCQPGYRYDGFGDNPSRVTLNTEGYTMIRGASFTGAEFANSVSLEVEPPVGDKYPDTTYRRTIRVDKPRTATVTISEYGAEWEVRNTNDDATPTTTQPTPTKTPSPDTTTTPSPTTTYSPTPQMSTTTESEITATPSATTTPPQRGFFSNSGENSEFTALLSDPYFLTVGGFALSAAGIFHQLIRGR